VGAIGLGAGALACYARPGERLTFFEIDPEVWRIARDPRLFTYLRDCPADVVIGDGRRSLVHEPPGRFGLLVVDAFNSDAIPVHLITRQALGLYLTRVGPHGSVLFHISNRYLRLEPVLGNLARDAGVVCRVARHSPSPAQVGQGIATSKWAILARTPADLGRLANDPRWRPCAEDRSARVWTDDYSDLLGAIAWD
jgi:spermidine synthase